MTDTVFPRIDAERLLASLQSLGQLGALPGGGVNRLALTDADRLGRDWTVQRMRELGMEVRIDAIGNGIAVYPGQEDRPPVMMGSHIDTVRTGGLYDGNYGVLAGLEVIATLRDAGLRTRRPLAVAFFTNEEGARFQPNMMGSLVYVGGLPLADALTTHGIDGPTVGAELARIGYAGAAPVGAPQVDSYVELHIEQGLVLEQQGRQIGIVEGVQGISWTEFTLEGTSNHAGTTPMAMRHDAGLVASRIAVFARELALRLGGRQLATVGLMEMRPGLVNVVPNEVLFTVDLRNTDEAVLQQAEAELLAFAAQAAEAEGVRCRTRPLARFAPVAFDPRVVEEVAAQAGVLGLSTLRMPSGAGHDAQILARVCPAGMIFVPSAGGLSHNVREYTAPQALAQGAQVLLQVVMQLADRP
ncbi:MAG: Zn-dependent hydrolase [Candidatus Dactylopiibacterium carminicum]|uniref:Zn-dependent hydrolase n=1 Tax=Candidatus Dactylopiibacterium carminicum TaxID=857335 RepID=UPI000BCEEE14|nr:Zn-dependent hydrolase [Candidatus Dactylopiibacterium carminicum]PAS96247.1 MAG: Zn-dependent hydrolase [Candidatus Dactylopiibacterium carminicum]